MEDPLRNPALSRRNAWNINRNINDFWKKEEEIRAKELVNDNFSRKQQGQSFGKSFSRSANWKDRAKVLKPVILQPIYADQSGKVVVYFRRYRTLVPNICAKKGGISINERGREEAKVERRRFGNRARRRIDAIHPPSFPLPLRFVFHGRIIKARERISVSGKIYIKIWAKMNKHEDV